MSPYPADLGVGEGRIVIPNTGYRDDGDAYTVQGVSRPAPGTPNITALTPATIAHTAQPLTVKITGTNFALGDVVTFGGASPPTQFHNDKELAVNIDPRKWSAGQLDVQVAMSTRGPSNRVQFAVT